MNCAVGGAGVGRASLRPTTAVQRVDARAMARASCPEAQRWTHTDRGRLAVLEALAAQEPQLWGVLRPCWRSVSGATPATVRYRSPNCMTWQVLRDQRVACDAGWPDGPLLGARRAPAAALRTIASVCGIIVRYSHMRFASEHMFSGRPKSLHGIGGATHGAGSTPGRCAAATE